MDPESSDLMRDFLEVSPRALRIRVARRAREVRLAAGRSQADLAATAGVSLPTLGRFEAGANVGIDVLVRVAIALGAERELRELFPLPDVRTPDGVLEHRRPRKRGRAPRRAGTVS